MDLFLASLSVSMLSMAVAEDLKTRTIPNWIPFFGMFFGMFLRFVFGGPQMFLEGLLGLAVGFLVSFVLWKLGWIGGGDQKLISAAGALLGFPYVMLGLALIAVSGGVQALVVMWHAARFQGVDKKHLGKVTVPYSVAILMGVGLAFASRFVNLGF